MDKTQQVIDVINGSPFVGRLVKAVTSNLVLQGKYEEALTYLLGAEDAFAEMDRGGSRGLIHQLRFKIKEIVR